MLVSCAAAGLVPAAPAAASPSVDPRLPGDLDPTFGDEGRAEYAIPWANAGSGEAITVAPDGSVLVGTSTEGTTSFAVARLTPDGAPDLTFGTGGMARFDLPSCSDSPPDLEVLDDGAIVVGSGDCYDVHLARLTPDGLLDTAFGDDGVAEVEGPGRLTSIEVVPDGSAVATYGKHTSSRRRRARSEARNPGSPARWWGW